MAIKGTFVIFGVMAMAAVILAATDFDTYWGNNFLGRWPGVTQQDKYDSCMKAQLPLGGYAGIPSDTFTNNSTDFCIKATVLLIFDSYTTFKMAACGNNTVSTCVARPLSYYMTDEYTYWSVFYHCYNSPSSARPVDYCKKEVNYEICYPNLCPNIPAPYATPSTSTAATTRYNNCVTDCNRFPNPSYGYTMCVPQCKNYYCCNSKCGYASGINCTSVPNFTNDYGNI